MCVGYCKVYRSCFRTFGAKVLEIFVLMIRQFHRNESSWNVRSCPEERKFHGSECSTERKFLEPSLPRYEERMFHGTKVPRERKFSLWSFRSREWKCRGTKRPGICGPSHTHPVWTKVIGPNRRHPLPNRHHFLTYLSKTSHLARFGSSLSWHCQFIYEKLINDAKKTICVKI